ncbi:MULTISPECIES: hypothetical protein [unclassified Haladaptatus]|uniref:DUF7560 family zinc ribbon protein n=1 Tax=unclassified Haladaptatus TaxID=2622732 RepID=UPI00209C4D76|nr:MULTISPECIES: hypothetical protein [unclassified Haladaptatus]MCO8242750.1 hypothetical protein [Haladaptatus sp. AB643]MCO8252509.1 hypothetical protein [Haladaptatus sp. AB618]
MSSEGIDEYIFACPECGETLTVNDSMRVALIGKGCVICGSAVTADAFTEASIADSS